MEIIEYDDKYLEDVKDLLVELEKYIIEIDEDHLDCLHEEYRDKMAKLDLDEVYNNYGMSYLAILDNKVVGVIIGIIRKYDEFDYLDYKCPKSGEVIELIVSKKVRGSGVGQKLMEKMENYFKNVGCEYIFLDVFNYNKNAIKFYEKQGYHTRMRINVKKI